MTATETNDPAPNWAGLVGELHCPLCEYNLRGLEQPRCPECGFAFSWIEILRGQEQKHPYLFEHQTKRNIWSFWKTYWRDCQPRKFWSELSPAQPVKLRRLMIFWFIASLTMFVAPVVQFGFLVRAESVAGSTAAIFYSIPGRLPGATPPTFIDFVQQAWRDFTRNTRESPMITGSLTALAWPWLTLVCLMLFSQSMHRAKIRKRHVLRVVIYGTDFGFLLLILLCLGRDFRYISGWPIFIAFVCSTVTLYRVYFGYSRYLRFHMPLATVVTSQIIVLMMFVIVYLHTYTPW